MIDWDILWRALGVLSPLLVAIYTFFATRRKDLEIKLENGHSRMDRQEIRISRIEQTVSSMPGKDDTHRLELLLADMSGDLRAMNATMAGMSDSLARTEKIVGRHEEHMLEGARS